MKPITIAERYRPFSHRPGAKVLLPGLGYQFQVFPCRLFCPSLSVDLRFNLKGAIDQFTVCSDLETGQLLIWGQAQGGPFRIKVLSGFVKGFRCTFDKTPEEGLEVMFEGHSKIMRKHEYLDFATEHFEPYLFPPASRLSFGQTRVQDWDQSRIHTDLQLILPIWHRLGQMIPLHEKKESRGGALNLLSECEAAFQKVGPEKAIQSWKNLFAAGFKELFVPSLFDEHFLGLIDTKPLPSDASPLILLCEGRRLITQMFYREELNSISILPYLLPCFHAGRLSQGLLDKGELSLEWTKKTIRRLLFRSTQDQQLRFQFKSDVHSFRLRTSFKEKGIRCQTGEVMRFEKDVTYAFDNFQS